MKVNFLVERAPLLDITLKERLRPINIFIPSENIISHHYPSEYNINKIRKSGLVQLSPRLSKNFLIFYSGINFEEEWSRRLFHGPMLITPGPDDFKFRKMSCTSPAFYFQHKEKLFLVSKV